jgi:hypothetical protein
MQESKEKPLLNVWLDIFGLILRLEHEKLIGIPFWGRGWVNDSEDPIDTVLLVFALQYFFILLLRIHRHT